MGHKVRNLVKILKRPGLATGRVNMKASSKDSRDGNSF